MELVGKRVGNRSSWNEGKVGYNTFIITSVLLFLHFNLLIRQKGSTRPDSMFRNSRTENVKLTKLQPLRSSPSYKVGCVFPMDRRLWSSSLYCPMRNSDEMTIENTHPTLIENMGPLTKIETDRVIFGQIYPVIGWKGHAESPKMGKSLRLTKLQPSNFHLRTIPDRANIDVHDRVDLYFYLNSSVYRPSCLDLWPFKFTLEILLPDFWLAHQSKFDFEICNFKC